MKTYSGMINELKPNQVFVFGSNGAGAHFGGAAATAHRKFGAIIGQSEGFQGQSYGIDTMDGLEVFAEQASHFIKFAEDHPELEFLLTDIGCGIAGYSLEEIAPLFKGIEKLTNIQVSEQFNSACNNLGDK
ncbi:MAG: hypothetical protein LBM13_03685 [Candidatus Ancillula sp.]|jgi:hypothetical protein|nr:hypothetical protein [Candidatus Ancillula sp.]